MAKVLEGWGVPPGGAGDIVQAPTGVPVAQLLASGAADIGFQQMSELLGQPGIDIVGTVPSSILAMTVFSLGLGRDSVDVEGAHAVMAGLVSGEAHASIRRYGMEPGA